MSLVRILVVFATFYITMPFHAFGMTLATDGTTDYVIVPGDAKNPIHKSAAEELQKYLKQITGAEFPIRASGDATGHRIIVGYSETLRSKTADVTWSKLSSDSIIIRTSGDDLLLAGGEPRGTLYAVYTFLEDTIGVRWWTSTEEFVPRKTTLQIPDLNTTYTPAFSYREAYYRDPGTNPAFAVKLKLNGQWNRIPPELGGHYEILGLVHTFYRLLPPEKYFKEHPEWYSLIRGKRTTNNAQLCLTNDDMRKELTRCALEWIKKKPHAGYISISQNDFNGGQCECDACRALELQEHSPAGPLIHFINKVAADITKEYPDFKVETLAYQYTRKAPEHVKPAPNVLIRLCTIECMFNRPLTDPVNRSFAQDIRDWQSITPNLFVWDYVTNFSNYLSPHPNLHVLAPNLRFFRQHGVTGLFEQGDIACPVGDFVRLRAWLLAHLLWNPTAVEDRLRNEFLRGYYGPAAEPLNEYLSLIQRSARDAVVGCYNKDYSFLTLQDMNLAETILNHAAEAVADDPVLAARVRRERLSFNSLWILRYEWLKREAKISGVPFGGPSDPVAFTDTFIKELREFGGDNVPLYEGAKSFDDMEKIFRAKALLASHLGRQQLAPAECGSLATDDWSQIQDQEVRIIGNQKEVKMVTDPLASDQSAICMPGGFKAWYVQITLPADMLRLWKGPIHIYASVRVEATSSDGTACSAGIYDAWNKKGIVTQNIPISHFPDGTYHTIDLGEPKLNGDSFFWMTPGNSENVKNIYIDRIWLVRGGKK